MCFGMLHRTGLWSLAMRSRFLTVASLSVLFLSSSGLMTMVRSDQTAQTQRDAIYGATVLKAGHAGQFFATANINGTPVKVVIDTGASAVALPYADAERAGLKPRLLDYNIPISTANGTVYGAEAVIRRVEIDSVKVSDVRALVLPEGALNITLVGMSFLARLQGFQVEDGKLTLKN
jgi:aspartyl protease family protein